MESSAYLVYSKDPLSYAIARNNFSHAMVCIAQSSELIVDQVAERWLLRRELASKVDYVVDQHGFNDLGSAPATILARYREMKRRVNDLGAKYIICTIYPSTTSSNTVKGSNDATRISVNNSIRSGFGDLHDGYLEVADAIETDASNKAIPVRNGGFFIKPDGVVSYAGYVAPAGDIYNDGTHASDVGNQIVGYTIKASLNTVMPIPS